MIGKREHARDVDVRHGWKYYGDGGGIRLDPEIWKDSHKKDNRE